MIQVNNVTKKYGETAVVDNVNLLLPKGGVVSIIGPNGAGKSTLLSMISRVTPLETGSILVDDLDIQTTSGNIMAKKLAFLRQDNSVAMRLTVDDLVAFGRYPYSKGRLNREDREYIDNAIAFLGLNIYRNRFLDELSGGQRQRAFIAMILCQNTEYVLLDEPLNSLDIKHAVEIMQLMRKLADQQGKTVVIVLHDVNYAAYYSDHIVAMKNGSVAFEGGPDELLKKETLRTVYDLDLTVQEAGGTKFVVYFKPA